MTERYVIRAVARALEVLKAFSYDQPEMTLPQLSQRLGLDKSTVFRLLVTLEKYSFAEKNPETDRFRLGVACLELGGLYLSQVELRAVALPILERLRDKVNETIHLATLDNMEVVYLEKLETSHAVGIMMSRVGSRAPAYCTGLGKALLAHQPPETIASFFGQAGLPRYTPHTITDLDALQAHLVEIRRRGYSLDLEEHEAGVVCAAAPVRDHRGQVIAAISIAAPASRVTVEQLEGEVAQEVMQAAREISEQMGYVGRKA